MPIANGLLRALSAVAVGQAVLAAAAVVADQPAPTTKPDTLFWDADYLARLKSSRASSPNSSVAKAMRWLRGEADAALHRGPYSVVDKSIVPPSGDKHDYLSYSRYWWPNPDTPDGLPYVRRDGVVNRELLSRGDRNTIAALYDDVESLALASYLIDADRYAPHAAQLLRTWFLDPSTRMNPHLSFGQAVPGRAEGRGVGIIDTRHFIRVVDSIALLNTTAALSKSDNDGLKAWFSNYLDWLLTSELGAKERAAVNNHGSWYAAQTATLALFVGRRDVAEEIVAGVLRKRIPESFADDGSQPHELKRTRSLHYCVFNLNALAVTACMGEHVGVDLWRPATGGGLRPAIDFVVPSVRRPGDWTHPMIEPFRLSDRHKQLFLVAGARYDDRSYRELTEQAPSRREDRFVTALLFPLH